MTRSGKAIVASAALVLLVGACGSSKSSTSLNPGATNGSGNSSPGSSGSGSGSGSSALDQLIAKGKTADIKITYKTSGGGGNNTFTLIQRGKDSVEQFGDSAIYTVGGKTATCTGTGSSATCTSIPGTGSTGALAGSLFTTLDNALSSSALAPYLKGLKTSAQNVAGRSAKCVTLTGAFAAALGGSGSVCVDAQTGILLKAQGTEKGGTAEGIEATSVGSPSDADFKLPATPKTISVPSYSVPTP